MRFTTANKTVNGNPALTGCPSGCAFQDTSVDQSKGFGTTWQAQQFWHTQTTLSGWVYLSNPQHGVFNGIIDIWGGGYDCGSQLVGVSGATPEGPGTGKVWCTLYRSSPSSLPSGQISGSGYYYNQSDPAQLYFISWRSGAFSGNGYSYYTVTSAQCSSAESQSTTAGQTWANNTWSSLTSGQTIVVGKSVTVTGASCSPGTGTTHTYPFTFTATVTIHLTGLAYNPAVVKQAAINRLPLDAGYTWLSRTACATVTTTGNSGITTVYVSCVASGLEAYVWTSTDKTSLAAGLAGRTVANATSVCNSWAHVTSGTCSINANGSSVMPSDPSKISINPQNPAQANTGATTTTAIKQVGGLPEVARLAVSALPALGALLSVFPMIVLRRRRRISQRTGAS